MKFYPFLATLGYSRYISLEVTKLSDDVFTVPISVGTPLKDYSVALVFEIAELYLVQTGCKICTSTDSVDECKISQEQCKPT